MTPPSRYATSWETPSRAWYIILWVLAYLIACTGIARAEATLTEVVTAVKEVKTETHAVWAETRAVKEKVEAQKPILESIKSELTIIDTSTLTLPTFTAATEPEIKRLKAIEGVLERVENVTKAIESHGFTEGKPLYTSTSTGAPASTVDVVSFGTGSEKDLSEMKEHLETVGWCVIGTLIALAVGGFLLLILKIRT